MNTLTDIIETKFIANKFAVPVKMEFVKQRIYLHMPYNKTLIAEIKAMDGAKWHGYDERNPKKIWSVTNSGRNRFQIAFLQGFDPYAPFDTPLKEIQTSRPLYKHQYEMTAHMLTRHYCVIAGEMGCIDGNAIVHVNRCGKGFQLSLKKLFLRFHEKWNFEKPTYVRSLCDGVLRLNKIKNILSKGKKPVLKLILKSGKEVRLTEDHEVCIGNTYKRADQLKIGDKVLSNGKWKDKDGYIRVGGFKNKHPRWTSGGVYEHILVMEKSVGRYIEETEIVHHKNEIRHDNRLENLELLESNNIHARLHSKKNFKNLHNGKKVQFLPFEDEVDQIYPDGETFVYDIICDDPHRNFVANGIIVHNCGKTLSAIETMEQSGVTDWWYVAPASVLRAIDLELLKWQSKIKPKLFTYEGVVKIVSQWRDGDKAPQGIIFDESSRVKTPTAKRTQAAFHLAESVREDWKENGFVILMSGSPAPKSPIDWWSQLEIACPGYIKEGNVHKFKQRLGLIVQKNNLITGGVYPHLVTWRDDENKCTICGKHRNDHDPMLIMDHVFTPSINEVSYLYERMKGLVLVKFKKDCLDLPDKVYRKINLIPSDDTLRLAKLIQTKSSRAIEALTLLRELSDGFQYIDTPDGETDCQKCKGLGRCTEYTTPEDEREPSKPFETICDNCGGDGKVTRYKREARQIETPKEQALIDLLEEHEDFRRIVVYAGFTGSIDRCINICSQQGWKTIRVDGRGWYHPEIQGNPLIAFQEESDEKIAFVGHPESGGMGLTLTASPTIVYYSNDFKAENRIQSEDRIHRLGMKGANIVDLIHLPTDELVLENLRKKRELQALSMGQLREAMQ